MNERIWLSSPHMSGEEQKYIQLAFDENYIAPAGSNINGFEKEIGEYIGIPHVAALTSGTSAIHMALVVMGITEGDIVLAPTFTFAACINPIVYQKAQPVFVDSDAESWNMNPELLEKAIIDLDKKGKNLKPLWLFICTVCRPK